MAFGLETDLDRERVKQLLAEKTVGMEDVDVGASLSISAGSEKSKKGRKLGEAHMAGGLGFSTIESISKRSFSGSDSVQ